MSVSDLLSDARVRVAKPRDLQPLAVGLRDAARLLGVSVGWLHPRAKAGEVPSALIGGRRLFRIEALRAWLIEREQAAGCAASDHASGT